MKTETKLLIEILESAKGCRGHIFRARKYLYTQTPSITRSHKTYIRLEIRLDRLKKMSCPGCSKCAYIDDLINDIDLDYLPIDGIEDVKHGQLYRLEGTFTHDYYDGTELDGVTLIAVNEEDVKDV